MNTKLRTLRLARTQTLTQVQAATGIDVGNLSRIERGIQEPKASQALALVRHFAPDLSLVDLVGDANRERLTDQREAA